MENRSFDLRIGGKNSGRLASGAKNLVDEVSDCDFAGGAGDTDEPEVTGWVTVIRS